MPHLWDIHLRRLTAGSQPLVAVKVAPAPRRHYQKVGNPAIRGFIRALGFRVTIVNLSKHSERRASQPAKPEKAETSSPDFWMQQIWKLCDMKAISLDFKMVRPTLAHKTLFMNTFYEYQFSYVTLWSFLFCCFDFFHCKWTWKLGAVEKSLK